MPRDRTSLFLSRERIEALGAWRSPEPNAVSLYLPVDASGSYAAALDRLIRDTPKNSLPAVDVERIVRYVRGRFVPGNRRGLCAFSCAKYGLFETFASPDPFHASLSAAETVDIAPLAAASSLYRRFLLLLADAERARFVESHLGEWEELEDSFADSARLDAASLAGRAEHWRRRRGCALFVLGIPPALRSELEPLLPAELREALIVEPLLASDRPVEAAAELVAHQERKALKMHERVLVERFLEELREGGAVAGLEPTAAALQQGCARFLLIAAGYAKMGRCCPQCGRLSVAHRACPWCFRATAPVLDVVSELAERAAAAGVEVCRVEADPRFEAAGRIGACLAVPAAAPREEVPERRALRGLFATKRTAARRP